MSGEFDRSSVPSVERLSSILAIRLLRLALLIRLLHICARLVVRCNPDGESSSARSDRPLCNSLLSLGISRVFRGRQRFMISGNPPRLGLYVWTSPRPPVTDCFLMLIRGPGLHGV